MNPTPATLDTESMAYQVQLFFKRMEELLTKAGLSMPNVPHPVVEYSHIPLRCYDPASGHHDFNAVSDYGYLEALGTYQPDLAVPDLARIYLFHKNLLDVARVYVLTQGGLMPNDPAFDAMVKHYNTEITTLVLCHELAHWLVHQARSEDGATLGAIRYRSNDEVFFHEGLAQALLVYGMQDFPDFIDLMLWMESGQPEQYIAYKRLGQDHVHVVKAMDLLRQMGMQSFELLEQAIHAGAAIDKEAVGTLFANVFKKPMTPEFQRELIPHLNTYLRACAPEVAHSYRGAISANRYGL